jgi:hypothetical protein
LRRNCAACSASSPGGGISNTGSVTLTSCTISGNTAIGAAGGVGNDGTATLTDCTVSGNSAQSGIGTDPHAYGGGIGNSGMLTLSNCTVSGNSAADNGGGIANNGTLMVTDSTLSANSPGGIYNEYQGTLTVTDSTLSGNIYSGIYSDYQSTLTLSNTIVAANTFGGNPSDIIGNVNANSSYNLIGTGGSGGLIDGVNHNHVGVANPGLGPLGYYGGPMQTMALLPGSPALNAGDPNELGTADQRGVVRSGGVNIGAYQASATTFLVSAPDMVQAGVPFDVTVTAVDPFNQVAVGYTGTVTFSTSDTDPGAVLPAAYTFTLDDGGTHTFTDTGLGETTLITPGDQTLTVISPELTDGKGQPNPNSGMRLRFGGKEPKKPNTYASAAASVAVHEGLVIAPDCAGYVHCLDAKTGQPYWKYDVRGMIVSSPLIVDGTIYVTDDGGMVHLFALSKELRVIRQIDMGEQIWTSPVYANGTLYVATNTRLYAIAGKETPTPH